MFSFECDNIPEKYPEILRMAFENGRQVEPRGLSCLEISPLCISATSPRKRLFGTPGRNENPLFAYIEGMWILKGEDAPEMISHYVKQTFCYVNPRTGKFDGAYGPRVRNLGGMDQLDAVYKRLLHDRETRRAIITVYDPRIDNNDSSLDVPCTVSWQFMIRNDRLDMITYMRSNDLFRGFVYDTTEFQWFQEILAGWLEVEVGKYTHMVGSAHIYLIDQPKIERILSACRRLAEPFSLYSEYVPQDARLSREDFEPELRKLAKVEKTSRNAMLLADDEAEKLASSFQCRFYRNLALAIAGFNARKFGEAKVASRLFDLIDNEFNFLMQRGDRCSMPVAGSTTTEAAIEA